MKKSKADKIYNKLREKYTDEEIAESMILPSDPDPETDKLLSEYIKSKKMELTSDNVNAVFISCLFNDDSEDTSNAVMVEGIRAKFGFQPERLKAKEDAIIEFLKQLPEAFRVDKGGGWSFLQAIEDSKGNQWAGHENVEQLMTLGMAIGRVKILLPRDMWIALPGGMPYFSIDVNAKP